MELLIKFIPRLLSAVLSWISASTLRERMYTQAERIEILETALEDIQRISESRVTISQRHKLIVGIIERSK